MPVSRLLKVPAALSDDHAALIEPLAIATHDVSRAGVKPGDRVLVFGGGPIGALIAMVARHRGADVVVAEIKPFRLKILASLGLSTIGPDQDAVKFANDCDAVSFDFTSVAGAGTEFTGNPNQFEFVPEDGGADFQITNGPAALVGLFGEP